MLPSPLLALLPLLAAASTLAGSPALYKPAGAQAFDFWYAKSGATYFAYYLQRPDGSRNGATSVGLATSTDLVRWIEAGEILRADPRAAWCNDRIATGSTWRGRERWQMLITAHGGTGGNVGLAESEDLRTWRLTGPAQILYRDHLVPEHPYWQSRGLKAGDTLAYRIAADPYVLPDPIDGWHYMIANCVVTGRPVNERGCVGLLRSQDGRVWEDCGIISLMLDYDRPETPQLWQHGSRWYLYFGGARENERHCRHNRIFTAESMRGPFAPPPLSELKLPDGQWFYIAKVIRDPQGNDVLLAAIGGSSMSLPYAVTYGADGSLTLRKNEP